MIINLAYDTGVIESNSISLLLTAVYATCIVLIILDGHTHTQRKRERERERDKDKNSKSVAYHLIYLFLYWGCVSKTLNVRHARNNKVE